MIVLSINSAGSWLASVACVCVGESECERKNRERESEKEREGGKWLANFRSFRHFMMCVKITPTHPPPIPSPLWNSICVQCKLTKTHNIACVRDWLVRVCAFVCVCVAAGQNKQQAFWACKHARGAASAASRPYYFWQRCICSPSARRLITIPISRGGASHINL